MEKILIIGAGGFGREVQWLLERINAVSPKWMIEGYVDDGIPAGTEVNGYSVLGGMNALLEYEKEIAVVCAVGVAKTRKSIIEKLLGKQNINFPNIIDPSVECSTRVEMGEGNIVCASTILTVDIVIDSFNIINLDCTIGHDVTIGSFVTIYPSVNVSGNVVLGDICELGTGTQLIQGVSVGSETIVGAGSVVIRDLPQKCTAVGNPGKPIKYHE